MKEQGWPKREMDDNLTFYRMLESVSSETGLAVSATPHVVCSSHVLMCGALVLMGWPGQQYPYSIIAPCQQHNKTN